MNYRRVIVLLKGGSVVGVYTSVRELVRVGMVPRVEKTLYEKLGDGEEYRVGEYVIVRKWVNRVSREDDKDFKERR